MKILFLSQRFLLPMDTGGKIRTGKILEQLSKEHDITLISNFDPSRDTQHKNDTRKLCSKFIPVSRKKTDKHSLKFFIRLFFQMFSPSPVSALNDYSISLQNAVEQECYQGRYDLAICDFVQSAMMFKNIKNLPTVLFQHNVESMIARRHIERATNFLSKSFWWLQWKKMFEYEKRQCNTFDKVIAVSINDKQFFENFYSATNIETIPTGVDIEYFKPQPNVAEKKNSLVFCGSMDWLPNEDAINYFIDYVLPLIKTTNISLTVVGRNPSPRLKKKVKNYPEISLTGWVEDIRPYVAKSSLFIVPLRIGGGTRMKIFEAMSMGKTVISTTVGAEGLPLKNRENIIIVDDTETFAAAIIEMLKEKLKNETIANNARKYVEQKISWQKTSMLFSNICSATAEQHKVIIN